MSGKVQVTPEQLEAIRAIPKATALGFQMAGNEWSVLTTFSNPVMLEDVLVDQGVIQIALPWAVAKALHVALGAAVTEAEKTLGQIALPPSFSTETQRR